MSEISFVMLNYNQIEPTLECVDSLKKRLDTDDYSIIIVDNGSVGQLGKRLQEIYLNDKKVIVICNEKNLGFSRGLNVGYRYAREMLKSKYIALINNDIILQCDNFFKVVTEDFKSYHYAVIGPHIETYEKESKNINPYHCVEIELNRMLAIQKKQIIWNRVAILLSYLNLDRAFWRLKATIGQLKKEKSPQNQKDIEDKIVLNTGLHGCFWLFSPLYTESVEGLQEITFLYLEEWLLYNFCKNKNFLMMYDPRLRIFHAEHAVMKKSSDSTGKKARWRYKMEIEASKNVVSKFEKVEKNNE